VARAVIIFEDEHLTDLYPLTLTRPVSGLRCGILTLAENARLALGALEGTQSGGAQGVTAHRLHVRDYLFPLVEGAVSSYRELVETAGSALLINARALVTPNLVAALEPHWRGAYTANGSIVAAGIEKQDAGALDGSIGAPVSAALFSGLPVREVEATLITYPWDIVNLNGSQIESDFRLLGLGGIESDIPESAWLVNEQSISVEEEVDVAPGVVLDASEGPIHVAAGSSLMANASLKGPLHIGEGSIVKMGAKIYGETSIGPACKIGGEVAETIVHGHSNKQHGGFVGHSYLGEWVNLGAGTDTSDLKNNYSTVKVRLHEETIDSGEMFVGLFVGDHSKCGIGTTFNTGTVVGACCNIFGPGYPPKYIPSFLWGGSAGFEEHDIARALGTARRVMRRRGKEPGPELETVLRKVHEITGDDREAFIRNA
jgi:UDP-N-acetylglucosamine diphosphorylase/glucosamine-1-phosphate N-acetyltransferase